MFSISSRSSPLAHLTSHSVQAQLVAPALHDVALGASSCSLFVRGPLPWPTWPATVPAQRAVGSTSCPQRSAGSRRRRCGETAALHSHSCNRARQQHDGKRCSNNLVWLEAEWIQRCHRILEERVCHETQRTSILYTVFHGCYWQKFNLYHLGRKLKYKDG